jgi:hypothetical protein
MLMPMTASFGRNKEHRDMRTLMPSIASFERSKKQINSIFNKLLHHLLS